MYGGPPQQGWQQQAPHFQAQGQFHAPPPHMQPRQNFDNAPQHFRHAGLGAPGAAQNLPPPPNLHHGGPPSQYGPTATGFPGVVPSQAWNGEKFSLFVGSISDGVEDGWLERILGTAGPVLSLRRPSPPFAFVEYGDPESVLRCLEVVNGTPLVGKGGSEKSLLVKADEKTRARLDQYEAGRVKNEQTEEFLLRAKDDLDAIVRLMKSGEAPATSTMAPAEASTRRGPPERTLTHLQDLAPEDLPETSREVITGEIALFRERAAKRAAEKKAHEREMEVRRNSNVGTSRPVSQQNSGWGARGGNQVDPQSYNKPIGFVATGGGVKKEESAAELPPQGPTDEERERERLERERREAEAMYRDRERRLEGRERVRIQTVERERARERAVADQEDRDRVAMRERLSTWDDDKEADRGHEAFYSDRSRWRAQRRPFRARELEADARDRATEAQQLALLHKESEEFLERQADMFAKITEGKNRSIVRSLPVAGQDDAVKLSFGAVAPKVAPKAPVAVRPAVLGIAEDEDEGKKKRELIPLSYSDDEDEKDSKAKAKPYRMTEREKERKARDINEDIPEAKAALWVYRVEWSALTEEIINRKLKPMTTKTIVEYIGTEEDELLNAVVDHVRAHKGAAALVAELEPVLDEEATEFVRKIWRSLVYELAIAHAGISF